MKSHVLKTCIQRLHARFPFVATSRQVSGSQRTECAEVVKSEHMSLLALLPDRQRVLLSQHYVCLFATGQSKAAKGGKAAYLTSPLAQRSLICERLTLKPAEATESSRMDASTERSSWTLGALILSSDRSTALVVTGTLLICTSHTEIATGGA